MHIAVSEGEEYLDSAAFAARIGKSVRVVRRARKDGLIHGQKSGLGWNFSTSEVARYRERLAQREVETANHRRATVEVDRTTEEHPRTTAALDHDSAIEVVRQNGLFVTRDPQIFGRFRSDGSILLLSYGDLLELGLSAPTTREILSQSDVSLRSEGIQILSHVVSEPLILPDGRLIEPLEPGERPRIEGGALRVPRSSGARFVPIPARPEPLRYTRSSPFATEADHRGWCELVFGFVAHRAVTHGRPIYLIDARESTATMLVDVLSILFDISVLPSPMSADSDLVRVLSEAMDVCPHARRIGIIDDAADGILGGEHLRQALNIPNATLVAIGRDFASVGPDVVRIRVREGFNPHRATLLDRGSYSAPEVRAELLAWARDFFQAHPGIAPGEYGRVVPALVRFSTGET